MPSRQGPKLPVRTAAIWAAIPATLIVILNSYYLINILEIRKHTVVLDPVLSLGAIYIPAQAYDFAAVFYIALLILMVQKRPLIGCLAATILTGLATTAAWERFTVLGQGPRFSDLFLIGEMMRGFDVSLAMILIAVPCVGLLAIAVNFRRPRLPFYVLALAPLLMFSNLIGIRWLAPVWHADLMERIGNVPFQQEAYYGHFFSFGLNSYEEFEQFAFPAPRIVSADDFEGTEFPDFTKARMPKLKPRNIHIILIESLIDPLRLTGYQFSQDPYPPTFRKWADSANSSAVSPVFGAFTADPEFEVLCGLPFLSTRRQIIFNNLTADKIDCLPAKLAAQGWITQATIATTPLLFSVGKAYRQIGFQQQRNQFDLNREDLDGDWLSASSFFDQVYEDVKKLQATGRPYLNYVVTMSGHYPYPRDKTKRPDLIQLSPADEMVADYANAVHYNIRALENYVQRVRALDPDAFFVIFGDHAPILGAGFKGYRQGGLIAPGEINPTRSNLAIYQTELLISDGERPVPVGRIAEYELPYLIADSLSGGRFCQINLCPTTEKLIRPIGKATLIADRNNGPSTVCGATPTPGCLALRDWRAYYRKRLNQLTR